VPESLPRVEVALGLVGAGPAGGFEVRGQRFGRIFEPGGALGVGAAAAANVDFAAGERRRAAAARRPLEQRHLCARLRRLDGGAGPRGAEADDGDIRLLIPRRYGRGGIGAVQGYFRHDDPHPPSGQDGNYVYERQSASAICRARAMGDVYTGGAGVGNRRG